MRRLLQCTTLLFLLVALFAPLAEGFDRWDPPGLTSDTELPLFAVVLLLCLVLLVARLVAVLALAIRLPQARQALPSQLLRSLSLFSNKLPAIPPSLPLRI